MNVLDYGNIELIDIMGDDNAIVEAARVSTNTQSDIEKDKNLINYLMKNRHYSPFEMVELKFKVKCPIFVARQWFRHRTGSYNEISGRYTKLNTEFYTPKLDRIKAKGKINKQGSEGDIPIEIKQKFIADLKDLYSQIEDIYKKYDIANEINRIYLPVSTYTSFIWKIDLRNLFNFINLRNHEHAQYEIKVYAEAIEKILRDKVPIAYNAYKSYYSKEKEK